MVLNTRAIFACLCFFVGMTFHTKKKSTIRSMFATSISIHPSSPKSTMSSPVVMVKEGIEMKKQNKTKIGVGSVVKAKDGELENITREGRSRMMRKEVVGCFQSVVGENKFPVQLEYGQKKEISSSSLVFLSSKEEVEIDEPISHLPQKGKGEVLTVDGYPEVVEPCMFGKCMYLSVFYCLCYAKDRSTDMSEGQVTEERDPDLNEEEDIRMEDSSEEYWRGVSEEGGDKKKIHALS